MKILLFGKNGQVCWELNRSLLPFGDVVALGIEDADFSKPESLRKIVQTIKPDVIVNAVAYTAVDKAETEEDLVTLINGVAPGVLAEEAKKINALLVHYSTDYVFDGKKDGRYVETDLTMPLSVYGKTKLHGELAISKAGCRHMIFRTSWVYAAKGLNFLKTMIRLAGEKDEISVVDDQFGSPTSAEYIADVTALCISRLFHDAALAGSVSGIYHLAAANVTCWYEIAKYVIELARENGEQLRVLPDCIRPVKTSEFPTKAVRPANSQLDCTLLCNTFGIVLPDWRLHARRMVVELTAQGL